MADRYPMLPNNAFNPGMVQHQQQQMGQSHLQQDSHQSVPGFPDQGSVWQQQMQQMQNQFHPQSAGMDHVSPQVAELMRRQGQQQQTQPQQFGHPMGGGQPAGGPQPFHDNQQQPSQSHPGFQNPQTRSAMFQQANNPATHRQLDLMALALNQQQNGPINFAARMQQQQAALNGQQGMGQQPAPAENSFMSQNAEAMRRPSPSHPVVPPQGGAAQPPQVSRASFNTLQERATHLKNIISNQESQLMTLHAQRARIGDAAFMDKVRSVSNDIKNRKEHYTRLVNFLHQMQQQLQMNGGQQNMMQPNPGPQAAPPAWMQQGPSQPPFNQNGPNAGQPGGSQSNMQQPPRPNPGLLPQFSPNNGPFQQQHPAEGRPFPPIPPLEKARFENVYKNFCTQRNVVHSPRLMSLETRPIDLFELHTQVMLEGGAANVAQKDLWAVIGGRMGFVQFPASDAEPAKSGPGAAQHLAHVYKEYLLSFDTVYVQTVMEQRRKNDALTAQRGPPPMRAGISDPAQMQQVLNFLPIPPVELRRRGVPEQLIQFIENNRPALMKTVMDQGNFRAGIRPGDQNGMHVAQPPFPSGAMIQPGRPFMHPQNGMPGGPIEGGQPPHSVLTRPSREHLTAAMQHIAKLKSDYSPERMLQNVPPIDVPAEQRMEYNNVLEQLHRACMELDHKLPMLFAVLKKEDVVRRLVIIVQTAIQQRAMISSGTTRFLVTLETLRTMLQQVQDMNERFAAVLQGLMGKPPNMMSMRPPVSNPAGPPPLPQPTNGLPPQPQRPLNLRDPPPSRAVKRPNAAPSPTPPPPVASASTPVNNAPTPRDNMASPPASKSPKGKAVAKPKAAARRQSVTKKAAATTAAAATPPPPAQAEPAASPAGNNKRPREEEPSPPQQGPSPNAPAPSVANEPSPPKRQKTQWEGPPSEALKARAEMVENVKTEEDAAAFLEQMTELIKMATGNDGQPDSVTTDFSGTLDTLFKGFGAVTDDGITSLGMGDGAVNSQDGAPPVVDEFVDFFDFSSFVAGDEDDAGSKPETPELISSSSTNTSPESGSEVDTAHQTLTSDVKSEDFSEHLRLGVWKEVDGGESAYFHAGQWKWDSPMQSLEQPWAIFNS